MTLLQTHSGADAQRIALEPPPYGAGWPEVAHEAEVVFVYESEPQELGAQLKALLAYDAERTNQGVSG